MNKAFISWDYAKLIKLWKKQKTLDDFTVSSDFLETTKSGATPHNLALNHLIQ